MAVRRLAETQPDHFAFSPDNLAWAERTIAKFPTGRQASAVIPLLWRAQEQDGWVSKAVIETVASMLEMPTIRVLEVATFYTMFHLEPVGRRAHVQVCGTTPCMLSGAGDIIDVCRKRIHDHPHHLSPDGDFSWEEVECLGACVNAPMVQIFKDTYEDLTVKSFEAVLDAFARGETPSPGPQNGRHGSVPTTGLTTLTEITYVDDDVAEADNRDFRPTGAGERAEPDHSGANLSQGDPRREESAISGGEVLSAEQARREGRPDESRAAADARMSPEVANQSAGRADGVGRSDEAASAAMAQHAAGTADKSLPESNPQQLTRDIPGGHERDEARGPRSDRDSPRGDREG